MSGAQDTNARFASPVPAAVARQAAQAETLRQSIYEASGAPPPPPPAPPAPPAATNPTVVNPPAGDPPPPAVDEGTWEQRFRSLQGRFDTVVTELRDARTSGQRVAQLENQLTELTMRLNQAAARPPAPSPHAAPAADLLAADAEAWSPELMEAARRQARAEFAPIIDQMGNRLQQVEARSQTVAVNQTHEAVKAALNTLVGPDWNTINHAQGFHNFLAERDQASGMIRHELLNSAFNAGDANRVAYFFNAFRAQHTGAPPPGNPQSHTPAGAAPVSLESLAAPGSGRAAPSNGAGAPGQAFITQADITRFYSDVNKGKYNGRQAAKDAREAEIYAAMAEGRVTA